MHVERAACVVMEKFDPQFDHSRFGTKAGAITMDTPCYAHQLFLLPHGNGFLSIPTCALWHHKFLLTH